MRETYDILFSFKAVINNMAKENNVAAQSVLQTYMLERLLERISISKYKDNKSNS